MVAKDTDRSIEMVAVEQAVGSVLAHDITEIRPGQFKGPAFKKGYIIKEEDLDHLRRLGKEHLYVLHLGAGEYHEDDAARILAEALCGENVASKGAPSEGKIALVAQVNGLLKVNVGALTQFNMVPDVCCSSRHSNTVVQRGDIVAATRAIPLIISEKELNKAVAIAKEVGGILSVKEISQLKAGVVVTGNEIFYGRIEDKFLPILRRKLSEFGCPLSGIKFCPDRRDLIRDAILELIDQGVGLVLVAGGMSVDPDDVSRGGIMDAGATELVYGSPILPGAMFLYAKVRGIPLMGLPACVLYYKATVFDLMFPRVLAGETITRRDLAEMAHGGMCLNCATCHYPICPFGK